jgi:poly-gamma-glutamate synthesis protein (capsule biosynthesis protein)
MASGCAQEALSAPAQTPAAAPTITATATSTPLPPTATAAPSPTPTAAPTATPQPVTLTVVAVGDVMLGRMVNVKSLRAEDFTWPFQYTADLLRGADLTIGNLEGPLLTGCAIDETSRRFCADPRAVEGLAWAGFDALSLANNHARDFGEAGFEETAALLGEAGIAAFYGGQPAQIGVRGLRVGVLGFDDVSARLDDAQIIRAARQAAAQVDVLLAVLHWGEEYKPEPDARQQALGRALIDAGAHVVIGAHPHWVQPVEEYHGGLIFYSLGNFVFDQTWSYDTQRGAAARITLTVDRGAVSAAYEMIPVRIEGFGQPQIVER